MRTLESKALPDSFEVELATLVDAAPEGPSWLHEIKLDGYRLIARVAHAGKRADVKLFTRNGLDWSERIPTLRAALAELPAKQVVLDGELCSLRSDGVSSFQDLQNALRAGREGALVYFAFDLLWLDGEDLRPLPLHERKARLAALLASPPRSIRYSDHVMGDGPRFFARASELKLEGIISKRADSAYKPGRSKDWLKVKCIARQEFVIGGYTPPGGSRTHLGALLVGVREGNALRYAGIPVELYSATHESRRSLRMIAPSGKPVARRYFSEDGKPLDGEHIARGYPLGDDYIMVSDEELERLAPEQSRDIELSRFVDKDAISALFFEHAYVMAPTGNSSAAYRLLASTLEKSGKAGVARFVMRGKQYPVAIFGVGGLLRAHTMRFADELRTARSIGLTTPKVDARKAKAMRTLIGKHRLRGAPAELLEAHDDKEQKLEAAVRKKQKQGEDVVHVEAEGQSAPMAEVIGLVSILKQSLGQGGATKPKPAAKRAPAKKKRAAHGR